LRQPSASEPSTSGGSENLTPPPAGPPIRQAGTSFFAKLKGRWPIVLGILGSIAIFFVFIYAVFSESRRGQEPQPTPTLVPSPTPIVTVTPPLTSILTPTTVTPPSVVSSEGKIAFVRDGDVWVINSDGSDEKQHTFNRNAGYLSWSNDGTKILFRNSESDNQPESPDPSSLWIMDVDGKNLQRLTITEYSFMTPKFSPDNSEMPMS